MFRENGSKIKNKYNIQHLLDENGYIGRSSVRTVHRDDCLRSNEVRLYIDLIWSGTTYKWPAKGVWNMSDGKIRLFPKATVMPHEMETAVRTLYRYIAAYPYTMKRALGMTLDTGNSIIANLGDLGLIQDEVLMITDDLELEEIIANILKDK
jgi:hypothetical protein